MEMRKNSLFTYPSFISPTGSQGLELIQKPHTYLLTMELSMKCSVCVRVLNHFSWAQLFATLWTVACQASLSIRFSRQEYWCGLPCPPPGGALPDSGTKLASPTLQADSLPLKPLEKPKMLSTVYETYHACFANLNQFPSWHYLWWESPWLKWFGT